MARSNRRGNSLKERTTVYEYDGSAARELETLPKEQGRRKKRKPGRQAQRRYSVSPGYVVFLTLVCIAVSGLCVMNVRQKSTITTQYEEIASLENEYNQLKSNNDAKYNQVMDSVSLEDVKNAAQNELGMSYANANQIVYYDLGDDSYVRQYKDVPSE